MKNRMIMIIIVCISMFLAGCASADDTEASEYDFYEKIKESVRSDAKDSQDNTEIASENSVEDPEEPAIPTELPEEGKNDLSLESDSESSSVNEGNEASGLVLYDEIIGYVVDEYNPQSNIRVAINKTNVLGDYNYEMKDEYHSFLKFETDNLGLSYNLVPFETVEDMMDEFGAQFEYELKEETVKNSDGDDIDTVICLGTFDYDDPESIEFIEYYYRIQIEDGLYLYIKVYDDKNIDPNSLVPEKYVDLTCNAAFTIEK